MHSFFITGTDTNIGKTAVTCSLIVKCIEEGFRAGGMKPVAAGCHLENGYMISDDVKKIIEVSNVDLNIKEINPYLFERPIAPHISFKLNEIDIHLIKKYLRSFEKKIDYLNEYNCINKVNELGKYFDELLNEIKESSDKVLDVRGLVFYEKMKRTFVNQNEVRRGKNGDFRRSAHADHP